MFRGSNNSERRLSNFLYHSLDVYPFSSFLRFPFLPTRPLPPSFLRLLLPEPIVRGLWVTSSATSSPTPLFSLRYPFPKSLRIVGDQKRKSEFASPLKMGTYEARRSRSPFNRYKCTNKEVILSRPPPPQRGIWTDGPPPSSSQKKHRGSGWYNGRWR